MDELRMVRREDGALILANELGEEYRFAIDSVVAAEIRQLTKRPAGPSTVRPREIQALLRAGKSRAAVAEQTGLEEADVERFEEPVRAEQRYMLELARMVTVRTDPSRTTNEEGLEQRFGEVISERLIGLGNTSSEWRSWRDETTGWLIGLTFDSRDGEHDAIWSLDHRKRVLTPLSPDATNLSKIGEVGDRLIPKLRAVESEHGERFDSGAFDPDALLAETSEHEVLPGSDIAEGSALFGMSGLGTGAAPSETDTDAEYERRREIDSLAVSTPVVDADDLNQTSDLLDALRRRRGEREQETDPGADSPEGNLDRDTFAPDLGLDYLGSGDVDVNEVSSSELNSGDASFDDAEVGEDTEQVAPKAARNIWGANGVSGSVDARQSRLRAVDPVPSNDIDTDVSPGLGSIGGFEAAPRVPEVKPSKRGRSSIPSWDDILFGTRSDDDPA